MKRWLSSSLGLLVGLLLLSSSPVMGTEPSVLEFTNASGVELPITDSEGVRINATGDILVSCKLAGGFCEGLAGSSSNGEVPGVILTRVDGLTRLIPGTAVRVRWAAEQAAVCLQQETGPTLTTWGGPRRAQFLSGEYVVLPAVGTYTLSMRCFNVAGASTTASVTATVVPRQANDPDPIVPPNIDPNDPTVPDDPPVAPGTNCDLPGIRPAGFTPIELSWVEAWSSYNGGIVATFPQSPGYPTPIGSEKNKYTVVPFIPLPEQAYGIVWDIVQSSGITGYLRPRPADTMFFTISKCKGDLRAPVTGTSPDRFLEDRCRRRGGGGALYFGTRASYLNNPAVCYLEPGVVHYMTIAPVDPDFLAPGFDTCSTSAANSAEGCDVNAIHNGQ